jgi:hypothetical protein
MITSAYVAAALGVAVGVSSFLVARVASRMVTPEDAFLGFVKVSLVSSFRMLFIVAALAAIFVYARPVFPTFGISLVLSFIGTLGYEALRVSTRHRPARTS